MGRWCPPYRLILATIAMTVSGYFPVGYHMAVLNIPYDTFKHMINDSYLKRYTSQISETALEALWSTTVSSWQIGALIGAMNAFWIADRLGRKFQLSLICGPIHLVGSVFMILSPYYGLFELLMVGRLLAGISSGMVCPILHVFLSECSPDRHRGTLNSFAGFVLSIGVLAAMAFGLPEVWGLMNITHSQLLFGFCLPLNVFQIAIYPIFHATPKYLYLTKKDPNKAKASIEFYHGHEANVKAVFEELEQERILAGQQLSFLQALCLKSVRLPLWISVAAGVANSSNGVDLADSYSTQLFTELGLPSWESKLSSMMFNVAGMIGSFISIFVIDRCQRRTLLLSTSAICLLCNIGSIFAGAIGRFGLAGAKPGIQYGIAAVLLITIMELSYGIGPGAILEGLFAEVSPHKVRAVAGSISKLAYCLSNWLFVFLFPLANVHVGTFAFLISVVPSCACLLYFAYSLPETARKSVAEVASEILRKKSKRVQVIAVTSSDRVSTPMKCSI